MTSLRPKVRDIIMDSWTKSSKDQYNSALKKWKAFCASNNEDPLYASIASGTNFLLELYDKGLSYSAINTARSALSATVHKVDSHDFGKHPLIVRFMKGIFRNRPALPKYSTMYNPDQVLDYLKIMPIWENFRVGENLKVTAKYNLKALTQKLTTLLALASGHRAQTLSFLSLDHMDFKEDFITCYIPRIVKNTSPSFHPGPIHLPAYKLDKSICPVELINEYKKLTKRFT